MLWVILTLNVSDGVSQGDTLGPVLYACGTLLTGGQLCKCRRVACWPGGDGEKKDSEVDAEEAAAIEEARREMEEKRKEKHRKMEEEREEVRQGIRDKVHFNSCDSSSAFCNLPFKVFF